MENILSLLGYELKKAGAYHIGACPFCGGRDRFTIKHTPHGDKWYCRHCGGDKYHDAADFIMRRDGCNFKAAMQTMGGGFKDPPPMQPKISLRLPDKDWQKSAWREIDGASNALLDMPADAPAWRYLLQRGLQRPTVECWQIGYAMVFDPTVGCKRGALVIPWFDMDGGGETLQAVKYRFIDGGEGLRYSSKKGSIFDTPFGLWAALPNFNHGLILVEGELNCLSIWQTQPVKMAALSLGSEGSGNARVLEMIAKRYQDVWIWLDTWETKRGGALRGLIRGRGRALQSVEKNNIKYDANRLLQTGDLGEFLKAALGTEVNN